MHSTLISKLHFVKGTSEVELGKGAAYRDMAMKIGRRSR